MENQKGDLAQVSIYGTAGLVAVIKIPIQRAIDMKGQWVNKKLGEFYTIQTPVGEATIRSATIASMIIHNVSEEQRKTPLKDKAGKMCATGDFGQPVEIPTS